MDTESRPTDVFAGLNRKQRGRRLRTVAVAAGSIIVVAAIFLYVRKESKIVPWIEDFDPHACVRVQNVSRIFTIRNEPGNGERLWFATAEGIRVLDAAGFEWTRFGLDHGLPSETVNDITFSEGTPWVATDKGIARFDSTTRSFSPVPTHDAASLRRTPAIVDVPGAGVFYAVDSLGIYRVAPGDSVGRPVKVEGLNSWATITCLKAIDNGVYICAAGRVVVFHDPATGMSRKLVFKGNRPFLATMIWDIVRFKGQLIMGTSDDGIWTSKGATDTMIEMASCPSKGAFVFAEEKDGFWCGTPYGLWRYFTVGDAWMQFVNPTEKKPTDFQVTALAVTSSWLWYGSTELGAGYFNKEQVQWRKMRAGLSTPNVAAITVNDGFVWTGYGYRGESVDRFSADSLQYDRNFGMNDGITDPNIQTLASHGGVVYYGGFESFGYFGAKGQDARHFTGGERLPSGDISCIGFDGSGEVYLGSQFGVIRYLPGTDSFSVVPATRSHRVTSMELNRDTLWYGTLADGLHVVRLSQGGELANGLDGTVGLAGIAAVTMRGKAVLFVASKQDGCFITDRTAGHARKVAYPREILEKEDAGKPAWNIMAMRRIGSRIWIGTRSAGCLVYEPEQNRWTRLTPKDGLVSGQVRSFHDDDRYVWVGCFGGFSRMDKTWLQNVKFKDNGTVRR